MADLVREQEEPRVTSRCVLGLGHWVVVPFTKVGNAGGQVCSGEMLR